MAKKRILILGGAGFIGSNLLDYYLYKPEYEVYTTIWNKSLQIIEPNTNQPIYRKTNLVLKDEINEYLEDYQPHIVIQAAAVTSGSKDILEQPSIHITDNVIMNSLIFEACNRHHVEHCIFLSCSTMYPSSPKLQKEHDPIIDPFSPYFGVATMKMYCEQLCKFYAGLGNTKFTAIRHSNIYGPYDRFEFDKAHMVASMVRKVVEPGEIQVNGGQKNEPCRDILYVDDLLSFIDLCIRKQKSPYELLNCGYGRSFSVTEIINMIQAEAGTNKCISYNCDKKNIPTTTVLDCSKAKKLLDWAPYVHVKSGLKQTIKYYKNLSQINEV